MPGRAFVLGKRAARCLCFLLLLLALSGETATHAQSADQLASTFLLADKPISILSHDIE